MFIYLGKNKRTIMATDFANRLMQNEEGFLDLIKNREERFEATEVDCEDIAMFMRDRFFNSHQRIVVSRRFNPFGSVIAAYNPKYPNTIKLNAWKLKRTVESICGSIMHEYAHLVDEYYKSADFGHSYRDHPGREETAPYAIGRMAKEHCIEYFA